MAETAKSLARIIGLHHLLPPSPDVYAFRSSALTLAPGRICTNATTSSLPLTSDDGRLNDLIVRIQHRLHLGGADIEPGADDQFLGPTSDVEVPFSIYASEIACVEPSSLSIAVAVRSGAR